MELVEDREGVEVTEVEGEERRIEGEGRVVGEGRGQGVLLKDAPMVEEVVEEGRRVALPTSPGLVEGSREEVPLGKAEGVMKEVGVLPPSPTTVSEGVGVLAADPVARAKVGVAEGEEDREGEVLWEVECVAASGKEGLGEKVSRCPPPRDPVGGDDEDTVEEGVKEKLGEGVLAPPGVAVVTRKGEGVGVWVTRASVAVGGGVMEGCVEEVKEEVALWLRESMEVKEVEEDKEGDWVTLGEALVEGETEGVAWVVRVPTAAIAPPPLLGEAVASVDREGEWEVDTEEDTEELPLLNLGVSVTVVVEVAVRVAEGQLLRDGVAVDTPEALGEEEGRRGDRVAPVGEGVARPTLGVEDGQGVKGGEGVGDWERETVGVRVPPPPPITLLGEWEGDSVGVRVTCTCEGEGEEEREEEKDRVRVPLPLPVMVRDTAGVREREGEGELEGLTRGEGLPRGDRV